ncbi:MAG TPA: hypothetical protein VGG39_29870 [Polyangiaceae bacterium]|jgi:hypothetical protein
MSNSVPPFPILPHEDTATRLRETERVLRNVLEQLAQAETEITRLRGRTQVMARRGY